MSDTPPTRDYGVPTWQPVTVPVEAKVGKIDLRLFPYESLPDGPEGTYQRPWCWGAMCRVTFRFGRLVTSKKIAQRYVYTDKLGWAKPERPSTDELVVGAETVVANLVQAIELHGVKATDIQVVEHQW
jgi:hypothetical protein